MNKSNIAVINGPNLNLLGEREVDIYGTSTLEEIKLFTQEQLRTYPVKLHWFQSNIEGEIVEIIHQSLKEKFQGIVINPGGWDTPP